MLSEDSTAVKFIGQILLPIEKVSIEHSEPGTEVTFFWGEEGGGSLKPTLENYVQIEIRATVQPVPYSKVAREEYVEVVGENLVVLQDNL
jgi:hypothetical protein